MASSDVTFKAIHCWTNLFRLIYITSKLTRRMVRAFDSVCAFDACHALILLVVHLIVCVLLILVMLWWLSELLLSTGLSPHPPIWTNSPPCLYISASVLNCTVLVIAVENHKLNQLELFRDTFWLLLRHNWQIGTNWVDLEVLSCWDVIFQTFWNGQK